jgi:hypothetical protein
MLNRLKTDARKRMASGKLLVRVSELAKSLNCTKYQVRRCYAPYIVRIGNSNNSPQYVDMAEALRQRTNVELETRVRRLEQQLKELDAIFSLQDN